MKRKAAPLLALAATAMIVCLSLAKDHPVRGDEPQKPVIIPPDQIHTTCDEHASKYLSYGDGHPVHRIFTQMMGSLRAGASNVFLVRGDDIVAAMTATHRIFGRGKAATEAVEPDENTKSDRLWFGAFLGIAGSSPPHWEVKSIQIHDKRIRLTYAHNKKELETSDTHEYLVLAALGKISGAYTLELF